MLMEVPRGAVDAAGKARQLRDFSTRIGSSRVARSSPQARTLPSSSGPCQLRRRKDSTAYEERGPEERLVVGAASSPSRDQHYVLSPPHHCVGATKELCAELATSTTPSRISSGGSTMGSVGSLAHGGV
ncbi:hypothetical protein OsJ_30802 [Oryza sativa Japonica Group]|uniref:Uncharacterized protein n=1 Tax=Oryza sativa subsp. japonica TaxID=39947 RepID=B9G7M4_ORYSJ|nr:hypothetical protein OsJ_30802 [Oryza sativa Japonica Group]